MNLEATSHYHCVSRCVRRAFLCGEDELTGKCFDHRRQWLVDRFKELARIFSVNILAYAVMSNHYHLVIHVDREQAGRWTDEEMIERWRQLFPVTAAQASNVGADSLDPARQELVGATVQQWRRRLGDLSWLSKPCAV